MSACAWTPWPVGSTWSTPKGGSLGSRYSEKKRAGEAECSGIHLLFPLLLDRPPCPSSPVKAECPAHWVTAHNLALLCAYEALSSPSFTCYKIDSACSVVPEEFIQQHVTNGNPPTLFLPLAGGMLLALSCRPCS